METIRIWEDDLTTPKKTVMQSLVGFNGIQVGRQAKSIDAFVSAWKRAKTKKGQLDYIKTYERNKVYYDNLIAKLLYKH